VDTATDKCGAPRMIPSSGVLLPKLESSPVSYSGTVLCRYSNKSLKGPLWSAISCRPLLFGSKGKSSSERWELSWRGMTKALYCTVLEHNMLDLINYRQHSQFYRIRGIEQQGETPANSAKSPQWAGMWGKQEKRKSKVPASKCRDDNTLVNSQLVQMPR